MCCSFEGPFNDAEGFRGLVSDGLGGTGRWMPTPTAAQLQGSLRVARRKDRA